jgi:hypothetical protein
MADLQAGAVVYKFKADMANLKRGLDDAKAAFGQISAAANDNARQINAGMRDAEASVKKFAETTKEAAGAASAMGRTIGTVLGRSLAAIGVALGGAMISFARETIEADEAARRLGVSLTSLTELGKAGKILGLDPKKMQDDMVEFAKKLREAQLVGGDLADFMDKVGIKIKDSAGNARGVKDIFAEVAAKVRETGNELDKIKALEKLGLGPEWIRLFERGEEAVRKFAASTIESTAQIDNDAAEKARQIDQKWNTLWANLYNRVKSFTLDFIDTFKNAIDWIGAKFEWLDLKVSGILAGIGIAARRALNFAGIGSSADTDSIEKMWAEQNARKQMRVDMLNGRNVAGGLTGFGFGKGWVDPLTGKQYDENGAPIVAVPRGARSGPRGFRPSDLYDKDDTPDKPKREKIDPVDRYIKQLEKERDTIKSEVDLYDKSNTEKAIALALIKAGADATDEQKKKITEIVTATQGWKDRLKEIQERAKAVADAAKFMGDSFENALEGLALQGRNARDVIADLVRSLASAALKAQLLGTGPLAGFFGTAAQNGQAGGLLGSLFSSLVGSFMPGISGTNALGGFGPVRLPGGIQARADGGPVLGGRAYVVGERGPELYFPSGGGTIAPNGAGAGGQATVNIINNAGVQTEVSQRRDASGGMQIDVALRSAIIQDLHTNGDIAKAMQGRYGLRRVAGR